VNTLNGWFEKDLVSKLVQHYETSRFHRLPCHSTAIQILRSLDVEI
jgi:hypothetical protein